MLRNLVKSGNLLKHLHLNKRTYLSEAFKCAESWNQRLSTPILQKINDENLYYELDSKYQQQKSISAIDVDLYANKITDENHIDEIADLLHKMRLTSEATNILESTGHAVIRNYLEHNQIEALINVLSNRTEYGVFLDYFTANLVLDKLIQDKNYKAGSRISTIFMLQEEFENPITNYLSLYTCYKFLANLEIFDDLIVPEPPKEEETGKKKKKEEIKIRVAFIRNPYHDDHFDIKETNHLLGKTFLYLADEVQHKVLSNSLKLLGYGLYEKYETGIEFLESNKGPFFKETVEFLKNFSSKIEGLEEKEHAKVFFEKCATLRSLEDGNVEEIIDKLLKDAVKSRESQDIEEQKMIYSNWIQVREKRLSEELARLDRIRRIKKIEEVQKEMEDKEKKLWYFDNVDNIDLQIESNKVFYPKRWFGKKKKPRVVDENYIPPDVDRRRNK